MNFLFQTLCSNSSFRTFLQPLRKKKITNRGLMQYFKEGESQPCLATCSIVKKHKPHAVCPQWDQA